MYSVGLVTLIQPAQPTSMAWIDYFMHPYGHPLHRKVLKYFIYIKYGSVIRSEGVLGLTHVIVVRFVPSCYPDSASSTHLHGFDGLRMHLYGHPLHWKVLKYLIYIKLMSNSV